VKKKEKKDYSSKSCSINEGGKEKKKFLQGTT